MDSADCLEHVKAVSLEASNSEEGIESPSADIQSDTDLSKASVSWPPAFDPNAPIEEQVEGGKKPASEMDMGDAYGYARPSWDDIQWEGLGKRSLIVGVPLTAAIVGFSLLGNDSENTATAANKRGRNTPAASSTIGISETRSKELSPLQQAQQTFKERNVFLDTAEAMRAIESGVLFKEVTELAYGDGIRDYEFHLRSTSSNSGRRRSSTPKKGAQVVLRDIGDPQAQSAIRELLIAEGFTLRSERAKITAPSSGGGFLGYAGIIGGLAIAAAIVYTGSRNRKMQKKMMEQGGLGGLKELVDTQGGSNTSIQERYSHLGGVDYAIKRLERVGNKLKRAMRGDPHVKVPRGGILHGPGGTGKTSLVKAFLNENNIPYIEISASTLTEMLKGTGPRKITKYYERLRELRDKHTEFLRSLPGAKGTEQGIAVGIFEEFESLAANRFEQSGGLSGDDERRNMVTQMLQEMQGVNGERNQNVIAIATTNARLEDLDAPLIRPSRFGGFKIHVRLPKYWQERKEVLDIWVPRHIGAQQMTVDDASIEWLAKITSGCNNDDLQAILALAQEEATYGERTHVTQEDLYEAMMTQLHGEKEEGFESREAVRAVMEHEVGHLICGLAVGDEPVALEAIRRGGMLGHYRGIPEQGFDAVRNVQLYLGRMVLALGGRAGELVAGGRLAASDGLGGDKKMARSAARVLLDQSMVDDDFDLLHIDQLPDAQLPPDVRGRAKNMLRSSICAAKDFIRAAGPAFSALVEAAVLAGEEGTAYKGEALKGLIAEHITPETRMRWQAIREAFYAEPEAYFVVSPSDADNAVTGLIDEAFKVGDLEQ